MPSPRRQKSSRPRRILVLGAGGPVGRHLVPLLHAQGCEVVAVTQGITGEAFVPGILRVFADIPAGKFRRWVEGSTAAVNLANIETEDAGRGLTFDRMHRRTSEVAVNVCEEHEIPRLLQLSAIGADSDVPSEYHRSKAAADKVITSSQLDWSILKTGLIFGPGDWISNRLVPGLRRLPFFPIPKHGSQRLQPTAAVEVAMTIADLVGDSTSSRRTVEMIGPETVDFVELVRRTAAALRLRRSIVHLPQWPAHTLYTFLRLLRRAPLTSQELALVTSDAVTSNEPLLRLATPYRGPVWIT